MPIRPLPRRTRLYPLLYPLLCLGFLLTLAGPARSADADGAQRLWLAGQRGAAVALVEDGLRKTPNDLKLRFALGVMRMELGELKAAEQIFTLLSQDFPDLADPHNNLAVIHAAQGRLDQAQADLSRALTLQPDQPQALENLGDLLLRQAERAYQAALKVQVTPLASTATKLKKTQGLLQELDGSKAP